MKNNAMEKDRVEKLLRQAGNAINANDGRCGLIEDALCGTTSLCCAVLDHLEARDASIEALTVQRDLLAAACRDAVQTLNMSHVRCRGGVPECIRRIEAALANLPEIPCPSKS